MNIEEIRKAISGKSPQEVLAVLARNFGGEIVFSTSFGWEDQVISDMIFSQDLNIKVFTLDTGRMFTETYYTWNRTLEKYQKPIHAYYPNEQKLQEMLTKKGPSSFYESVENRKECCGIRKVEPLNRALKEQKIWI